MALHPTSSGQFDDADIIRNGDTVVIQLESKKQQALTVRDGEVLQTTFGALPHSYLIGRPFGCKVLTMNSRGYVHALRLTPELWTINLTHRTQVLYAHDISYIVSMLQLQPGKVVVESGTGSGSLSHALIRAVKPLGHLFTYEFHAQRAKDARKEFDSHGIGDHVTVTFTDVLKTGYFLENVADAVVLDLPMSEKAIVHAKKVLKDDCGRLCSFSPCIEQTQQTCMALHAQGFYDIQTFECLSRDLQPTTVYLSEPNFQCARRLVTRLPASSSGSSTDGSTADGRSAAVTQGSQVLRGAQAPVSNSTTSTTGSEASPCTAPAAAPTPSTGPDHTPSTGPDHTPSTGPDHTPSTGPDQTPSTGPDQTPSTGPDQTPSTGPDQTPSTGPDQTPSTGPDQTSVSDISAGLPGKRGHEGEEDALPAAKKPSTGVKAPTEDSPLIAAPTSPHMNGKSTSKKDTLTTPVGSRDGNRSAETSPSVEAVKASKWVANTDLKPGEGRLLALELTQLRLVNNTSKSSSNQSQDSGGNSAGRGRGGGRGRGRGGSTPDRRDTTSDSTMTSAGDDAENAIGKPGPSSSSSSSSSSSAATTTTSGNIIYGIAHPPPNMAAVCRTALPAGRVPGHTGYLTFATLRKAST